MPACVCCSERSALNERSSSRTIPAGAKSLLVESPLAGVHWSPRESTRVWTGWMPMAQGFWARSPRIQRHPTPPLKNTLFGGRRRDFRPKSESRRSTVIITRATLHDHAPNTYYGHWLANNAGKHAGKRGAIAHNETVASPGVAPFDVRARDSQGIARRRVGNLSSTTRKNLRASGRLHSCAPHRLERVRPFGLPSRVSWIEQREGRNLPKTDVSLPLVLGAAFSPGAFAPLGHRSFRLA
jgi:hypothetical protein